MKLCEHRDFTAFVVANFDALPGIASTVRLEPGIQSGDHPVEQRANGADVMGSFERLREWL